jgi:hypothetical protein
VSLPGRAQLFTEIDVFVPTETETKDGGPAGSTGAEAEAKAVVYAIEHDCVLPIQDTYPLCAKAQCSLPVGALGHIHTAPFKCGGVSWFVAGSTPLPTFLVFLFFLLRLTSASHPEIEGACACECSSSCA